VGSGLKRPGAVKQAAIIAFGVAGLAGFALAAATTWWLLAVGAVCFPAGGLYTGGPKPYGYYGFGELFVFVFFGLVATAGSAYVHLERITRLAVLAAVPVGLLSTALLVVNNLRDIPTDTVAGKRTLAVRIGDAATRWLYVAFLAAAFVLVVLAAIVWRPAALLGLGALPFAVPPVRAVRGGAA